MKCENDKHILNVVIESTGKSEKSELQMGFEPTSLLDPGGSWVQIPSGLRFFQVSSGFNHNIISFVQIARIKLLLHAQLS